jgi:molybdate transport system regulatory protein
MLELKYKIWLEYSGKVFGKGPYDLLVGVKETGSLLESAKNINMSYNKAFTLIKAIEKRLGYKLIESKVGGVGGGGSKLTPEAEMLMTKYTQFMEECETCLDKIFHKYFNSE